MSAKRQSFLSILLTISVSVLLSACASPANRVNMEVSPTTTSTKQGTGSVTVIVSGGQETQAQSSSNIDNAELQAAIEASVVKAGLFNSVAKSPPGTYLLSASIVDLSKPMFGLSFTVDLEIGWTLTRSEDKATIFKKVIKTSHTTGALEAFAGVTRLRMAVEGAAKKNIDALIQQIAGAIP